MFILGRIETESSVPHPGKSDEIRIIVSEPSTKVGKKGYAGSRQMASDWWRRIRKSTCEGHVPARSVTSPVVIQSGETIDKSYDFGATFFKDLKAFFLHPRLGKSLYFSDGVETF